MIFLECHNPAVEELLLTRFRNAKAGYKFEKVDYTVADFDRILYRIYNPEKEKSKLLVSLIVPFFDELKEYDVEGLLKREYGAFLLDPPQPGHSVTLCFDLENLPQNMESLAHRVSMLKRNCFAAVFEPFFLFQALAEEPIISKRAIIHYSYDEAMYVQALEDRITVIFSTVFKDVDDIVIGKIFMQEFTEVRRRFDRAPQVLYSHREPPAELRGTDAVGGENRAYITFVLFPRHLAPHAADRTINLIHTVRNYLHYHIKCAKGYLHMRMRAKTADFIKHLNRATVDHRSEENAAGGGGGGGPAVWVHALGREAVPQPVPLSATASSLLSLGRNSSDLLLPPPAGCPDNDDEEEAICGDGESGDSDVDGRMIAPPSNAANSYPPAPVFE